MRVRWYVTALAGVILIGAGYLALGQGHGSAREQASAKAVVPADADLDAEDAGDTGGRARVTVVTPSPGGIERTTTQPGSVHAFESADLYAKVSGYLKEQYVDIGDRVKQGQVLAVIDMPELAKEVQRNAAQVLQSQAQLAQARAHVSTTIADWRVSEANVKQVEADLGKSEATLNFREKQYARIKALFDLNSVDERLVDEKEDDRAAAQSAFRSAEAAVLAAKAQVVAAAAKIDQAKADVTDAEANVQVSQANLEKSEVLLQYTKIVSPYNGVITLRTFHPGDFIRAADQGGQLALLRVAKTDLMRVVVQVPDRDVPFTAPGEDAFVEVDALSGRRFDGMVSRTANTEDSQTRTMRTEIDLPNLDDALQEGYYGRVTIILHKKPANAWTIPASSLVGRSHDGQGWVYVVRGGHVHRTRVKLGMDNGLVVEVLNGLSANDQVVAGYSGSISDGAVVEVVQN